MSSPGRRFGAKDSATRDALVRAGIEVLKQEGAAAFSARRVAEQAGLKPQLVHYYFRTIEELVVAISETAGAEGLRRAQQAVTSEEPLRELWRVTNEERSAALVAEVKALGQNSEAIRAETFRLMEQHRILTSDALQKHLEARGSPVAGQAMLIVMICEALSRLLVHERALGFTMGHEQLTRAVEHWMDSYYGNGKAAAESEDAPDQGA